MDQPLTLVVPEELDGERLDKVIATLLGVSRATASEVISAGATVGGTAVKASERVRAGAVVEALPPPPVGELAPEPVSFAVLHQDPELIVVAKPAGVVVHPGAGRSRGTLAAGLVHRFPELAGVGPSGRAGLVHRLDRDTSGVLLVARTEAAHRVLTEELRARRIGRTYLALVHGTPTTPTGTIDAPLARDPNRPTRRAVIPGGKPARTHYLVTEQFPDFAVTLLEVTLETGRTHQIRVHLAAIDHPVVGDPLYSALAPPVEVPRIFLHALRVELDHPATGERVAYQAPLPPDLAGVLHRLQR